MTSSAEKARTTRISEIIRKSIQRSDHGSVVGSSFAESWVKYLLLVVASLDINAENADVDLMTREWQSK